MCIRDRNDVQGPEEEADELLSDAIDLVVKSGQASVSMLQRRFRIGYNRAARIMDMMEARGIVSAQDGSCLLYTSKGLRYEDAVSGRWKIEKPMPEAVKDIEIMNVSDVEGVASKVDFVFSAVDMTKEEIQAIEEAYAKAETPVVSNNSAHRWTDDVPMVIPEINCDHFEIIEAQKKRLGTKRGFIAVKPNCSIQSYVPVSYTH